jgi:hypothetical protein
VCCCAHFTSTWAKSVCVGGGGGGGWGGCVCVCVRVCVPMFPCLSCVRCVLSLPNRHAAALISSPGRNCALVCVFYLCIPACCVCIGVGGCGCSCGGWGGGGGGNGGGGEWAWVKVLVCVYVCG